MIRFKNGLMIGDDYLLELSAKIDQTLDDLELPLTNLKFEVNSRNIDPFFEIVKMYVKNDMLLLVTAMLSRYSYHMYSVPVAGQMLRYIEDQFTFYSNLNENIKKKILIRSKKTKLGWEDQERWVDRFPSVKVDSGSKSLLSLMR
jgi:putative transferase (TIGR04331 family)